MTARIFLSLLADACAIHGALVHGFCLMDNHFHVLLHCPDKTIGLVMHRLGGLYTQWFNERYDLDGRLFRNRFWSDPIEDDRHLLAVARYIDQNPLAFLTADELADYPWSGCRYTVSRRPRPVWFDASAVLDALGGDGEAYRRFVHDSAADPHFVEPPEPGPLRRVLPFDHVDQAIDAALGPEEVDRSAAGRARAARRREVAVLLMNEVAGRSPAEIANHLGLASAGSARRLVSDARQRRGEPRFAAQERLARSLLTEPAA